MPAKLAYANHGSLEPYDCTGKIGPLYPKDAQHVTWPMYSFDGPSSLVWNAIAANLHKRGWSDKRIKEWLASTDARYVLDGTLGNHLVATADKWASEHLA
jgi:hypothetical protein